MSEIEKEIEKLAVKFTSEAIMLAMKEQKQRQKEGKFGSFLGELAKIMEIIKAIADLLSQLFPDKTIDE